MIRFFAAIVCLAPLPILRESPAQDPSKLKLITGEVGRIDGKSISIVRKKLVNTFLLNPETKVLIQTDEFIDIGKMKSPKNAIGKIADVKVGQHVTVAHFVEDNKLVEIVVLRGKGK